MSGAEAFEVDDELLFPLDLLEGNAAQDAIRFCHFIEVLISSIEARRSVRTISDWVKYVEQVLQDLIYEPGDDVGEQHQQLMKKLTDYRIVEEWMPEPIAYEIFSRSLLQGLRATMRSKLYITGGITFWSLIPMRSIPFRVVAMLGLDYDKFPRKERMASFNLMLKSPRRGDRNVRDNDKHLFSGDFTFGARAFIHQLCWSQCKG
jgi:exodeoxyribonuclease V gamma subunit